MVTATPARNGSAVCPWRAVIGDSSTDGEWPVTAVDWPRRWAVSTPHKRKTARLDAPEEALTEIGPRRSTELRRGPFPRGDRWCVGLRSREPCFGDGRLEDFDRIARRVVHHDLPAANTVDDVVA